MKLYAKALIDLNISLGTMQRSHSAGDLDLELHQLAYFKANIGLTNAPRVSTQDILFVCLDDLRPISQNAGINPNSS